MDLMQCLSSLFEAFIAVLLAAINGTPKPSKRMQTAMKVLNGYNSLSVERILRPFDESTFYHKVLPESLGMPSRDKLAFSKHAAGITSVFEEFRMEPQQVFEDPIKNAVIIYARMVGKLVKGMGDWENECVMIMSFSVDGERVTGMQEFVDSAKAKMMKEKMAPKEFDAK